MDLFLTIFLVSFLLTFAADFIKLLKISKRLIRFQRTSLSDEQHQKDLADARAALEEARKTTSGEYARLIKVNRAEQKIMDIQEKITLQRFKSQLKYDSIEVLLIYAIKGILSVILLVISVWNRYTPVMVFDESFNFQPLEGLLSFPSGMHNAVSVPVWVFSCNIAFRHVSSIIKKKL